MNLSTETQVHYELQYNRSGRWLSWETIEVEVDRDRHVRFVDPLKTSSLKEARQMVSQYSQQEEYKSCQFRIVKSITTRRLIVLKATL